MTDKKDKKTLTLGNKKLGLKLGEKLSVNPGGMKSSTSGRVVVLKKHGKSNKPSDSKQANSADMDKRIALLQKAEKDKKQREVESKVKKNVEVESASKKADIKDDTAIKSKIEAPKVESSKVEDVPAPKALEEAKPVVKKSIPQKPARKLSKINLADLSKGNRVKNLDSIYKPEKKVEDKKKEEQQEPQILRSVADKPTKQFAGEDKKSSKGKVFDDKAQDKQEKKKDISRKSNKKLSVTEVMMMEDGSSAGGRRRSLASIKRAREKAKRQSTDERQVEKVIRDVVIPDFITVQELSNRMAEKAADVIKALMKMGMMVTVNQSIDADTAELIVGELGHNVKRVTEAEIEASLLDKKDDVEDSKEPRAPVVTIMGHVDHGKTSLLDALRNTDIVAGEAGGITQHIGAYNINLADGKAITFLDTPGHEAFTAMRMRGAKVTDIVVLVVAADDGIMPQTVEAISHSKAAGVPMIVAVNKIDKPTAEPDRVKQELLQHEVIVEDLGGDIMVVEVSAKQKLNLDKLEEAILLQAEMLELTANSDREADGAVVEAKMEKGRGPVATLLVQRGTIRVGDIVVAGTAWGRIRALIDDKRRSIKSAGPSVPVEIIGLSEVPVAGDEFTVVPSEKVARELYELRNEREKQRKHTAAKPASLDLMFKKAKEHGVKELPVIIKADVQGSVEAITGALDKLKNEEISARVLHQAVGGITESDITLAMASGGLIIGFNVRASAQARDLARVEGVEIKYYSVIYNLVDDVKAAMSGMLSPVKKEKITGYLDIREMFNLTKYGKVAGCYVTEGFIQRHSHARIIRDDVVIYEGKLKALKRFKDDVKEVKTGFECGLSFENYDDIKVGDKIEAYEVSEEARTL